MPAPRRRRLTLLPVGAALSVVLTTASVVMPGQEDASAPQTTTEQVDLTQPGEPVAPGWSAETERAPNLVGVEWQGDPAASFTIETRDATGTWATAGSLSTPPPDEGPDDGSPEAAGRAGGNVSEPLWVGDDVTGVRVRLDDGSAADVDLHTVDSPPASAPDGAAAAAAGVLRAGASTADRLVIAAIGIAFAGILVAWGVRRDRRPPRRRRRALPVTVGLVVVVALTACAPVKRAPVPGMANVVTRASWGADENLRLTNYPEGPTYMSSLQLGVVHHTVNSNNYSSWDGPALVRGIYAYHTRSLGYCDIGYNFLVDKYGAVYEGRYGGIDQVVMGAHARGFNTSSLGVAIIGDYRTTPPTNEAIEAVKQVLVYKFGHHRTNPRAYFYYTTTGNEKYGPGTQVLLAPTSYHQATGSTECPGQRVIDRIPEIYDQVATRLGY